MEKIKRLPDSEFEIMLIIWSKKDSVHTADILQKVRENKDCTLQMLQSTLKRLQNKNFISCQKIGKLNYYTPLIEQDVYRDRETTSFLEKLYHNSPAKLITTLLSNKTMSQKDIEEIRSILEKDGE